MNNNYFTFPSIKYTIIFLLLLLSRIKLSSLTSLSFHLLFSRVSSTVKYIRLSRYVVLKITQRSWIGSWSIIAETGYRSAISELINQHPKLYGKIANKNYKTLYHSETYS